MRQSESCSTTQRHGPYLSGYNWWHIFNEGTLDHPNWVATPMLDNNGQPVPTPAIKPFLPSLTFGPGWDTEVASVKHSTYYPYIAFGSLKMGAVPMPESGSFPADTVLNPPGTRFPYPSVEKYHSFAYDTEIQGVGNWTFYFVLVDSATGQIIGAPVVRTLPMRSVTAINLLRLPQMATVVSYKLQTHYQKTFRRLPDNRDSRH